MAPETPNFASMDREPVGAPPETQIPDEPGMEQRAVKSFAWAAASLAGNRLVVFVSTLVLARLLAPSAFGIVAAGLTIINFLEVGLDLGVSSAIIYEQEDGFTDRVHTAFILNVAVSAALTIIMVVAAPVIARFFHVGQDVNIFRALSLYLIIHGVGQTNDSLLQRDLLFKQRAVSDMVRAVVRGVVSIGLALAGAGAWAIVLGFLAAELSSVITQWIMVRFRPRAVFVVGAVRSLLKFGVSIVALDVLAELGINSDYLAVGNILGTVALGFYTIAFRLPELILSSVYWVFSSVAFPVYAKSRTFGDESLRKAMLRALRLATLIGFPVGVGLAIVARDAILVLFSAKWLPSAGAMTVLCLASGIGSIGYASGDIFKAIGRPWTLLAINVPATVLVVTGFFIAAPRGIFAVAIVHLVFNTIYALARLVVANHYLKSGMSAALRAMLPGISVAIGVAVFGIPARMATTPGLTGLLVTVAAGLLGGMAGVAIGGRSALAEVRNLMRALATRR